MNKRKRESDMPVGVITNVLSVTLGGIVGTLFGGKLSARFKENLTLIFSVCALGMGISSIILMKNMPAVILSVVVATAVGLSLHIGDWITEGGQMLQKPISKMFTNQKSEYSQEEFFSMVVTVIVLFCASGTGIYGCIDSGMTGDHTILISKSILDFFTALIFACNLGAVVSVIAVPQLFIFLAMYLAAGLIYPMTTPEMIADFKACGGFLLLATGFRMMKVKEFSIADMIPAMILVMPVSWIWSNYIVTFF